MNKLREAAQAALDALDNQFGWSPDEFPAIDALRAALAEAEQEHYCDTHCTWLDHAAGCVRAEPDLNLADPAVQKRLAAQWGYTKGEPQGEPDMRHPKIQRLIGANARYQIEAMLIEQLLEEGPDCETTARDMEYWNSTHDKLRDVLLAAQKPEPQGEPVARIHESGHWTWFTERGEPLRGRTWMDVFAAPPAPAQGEPAGWLKAIDDALVCAHLDVANADDSYETAQRKLNTLLCYSQALGAFFAKDASPAAPGDAP